MREHWTLEPNVDFLNHGSFGACPRVVLEAQSEWRARLERNPVRFFVRELEDHLASARARVAELVGSAPDDLVFVGSAPDDLVFVRNATEGANAILRSLRLDAGARILVTSQGYPAVSNAARYVAERAGGFVDVAEIPFPLSDPAEVTEAILAALHSDTRLVIVDHVTSPTGLVLPVEEIVSRVRARGVEVLVDGAHAPVMLPLELSALDADYYTGNLHKWACAPKGAAFLHVRADRQAGVLPTTISHGYRSPRDRSRYLETFDWTGTSDPSPWLCAPLALDTISALGGGFEAMRARNRELTLTARDVLAEALGVSAPAPDSMIGWLAALPLSDGPLAPPTSPLLSDALQLALYERHRIEVPIVPWPAPPKRLVRISAHLYNERVQYERLATALTHELGKR